MFKDKQDYEKYIEKQKVTNADLREENYFEHNDNGEIILKKQDYNTSALDVEKYKGSIALLSYVNICPLVSSTACFILGYELFIHSSPFLFFNSS